MGRVLWMWTLDSHARYAFCFSSYDADHWQLTDTVQRCRHSPRSPQSASVPQVRGWLVTMVIRACKSGMWTIGEFFHVPEEDEPCAIWLPLLHTGLCWYLLYMWILIKKCKSTFFTLYPATIPANILQWFWENLEKDVFLPRFCILQSTADVFYNVFGNESESLYIDIFWNFLCFISVAFARPFCSSGLDFTYYVCIISSWKYLF